ncbi:dehypoxanthine futalosine cyclase [Simkania negevensis]|uniref:Dehypoxanthine futalosine cyclase n=1 Tax=Simkania negevensis TaxID=83561 RepID=A0ABS3AQB4_9BACT|nr:dehypoxanthine futalosine cyclase [Simkania negevensis]
MTQRTTFEQGLDLFTNAPLEELKEQAAEMRKKKNPTEQVTFVLDSNPNYTNICNADCSFCAFYRRPSAKDTYEKSVSEVMQHLEFAKRAGLTTVLLQGGLNDNLKLDYYVDLVKTARERYPEIHPHFFSAPEIWNCARISKKSIREVLQALYDAGQRSFPGGGAEIISERVRQAISPKKMAPGVWIDVHMTAHDIGFRSTATMMYGHVEEPEDILIHLDTLRTAQDKNPGFTAFIPWSYKRDRTALRRKVKNWAGKDAYLRIIAFSRIYLDNFDHIQASWFSEGKQTGIDCLHYGADDFGGIILEENVHRAANFISKTDHNGITSMIRQAGYEPAQRDPLYNILRTYTEGETIFVPDSQQIQEQDHTPILQQPCCK